MRSITINTVVSNTVGGILSVLLGTVVGVIMSQLVLELSGLSNDWWFLGFFVPAFLMGGWLFQSGRQPRLDIGHKGILKFLDERWSWLKLSEGTHWLFPGMSIEDTSIQLQTGKPEEVEALAKDNVKMTGFFFLTFYVCDPLLNQNSIEPLRGLQQKGASKFRDNIAANASELLEEPEMWNRIGSNITRDIQADALALGYRVVSTEVTEILPPDDIAAANARLRIERAQEEYESVELKAVQKWIDELGAKGIKPELALEVMQTERDKAKATRSIIRVEGVQGIADVLAAATERLAEAMLNGRK